MNVLLIEDEDPKLEGIQKYLRERHPTFHVTVARSVKSGLAALRIQLPDLLLLDMSLPTFDITESEPGGRPQGFGGIEIVRYLDSLRRAHSHNRCFRIRGVFKRWEEYPVKDARLRANA